MSIRLWYYKHFDKDKLLDELSKPVEGEYIVIKDSPSTSTRIRAEELKEYARYFKEKGELYAKAYEKYAKDNSTGRD
ncbi:MAG: hypothetical protein BK997_03315 [Candidatus Micrarchaeum sp. ARMAN-1]|jgi:hypothetical protein|nr:MAG: hypothetical protein BK997_03315 [Candidatus Micrarchaeum sp. ARMAN-1]OJT94499.1 MAG: hypothetical protein JJ59_03655 [Candidatus Micrarchaeum sp. AZ1]